MKMDSDEEQTRKRAGGYERSLLSGCSLTLGPKPRGMTRGSWSCVTLAWLLLAHTAVANTEIVNFRLPVPTRPLPLSADQLVTR